MSRRLFAFLCSVLVFAALAVVPYDADAARFGGGRSFGGRPSMSTPFTRPTPSAPSSALRQQANQARQPGAAAAAAPGRGLFGGMGGLFGGLLAGSLIGSLLFGHGMGGDMGGFLDILIIALLVYFGFKFFARRRARNAENVRVTGSPAGQGGSFGNVDYRGDEGVDPLTRRTDAAAGPRAGGGFDWGALSSRPAASADASNAPVDAAPVRDLPGGFDEEEFLRGAKAAYTRLNEAWDRRDLDDIAQFSTPAFLDEIRKQREEDPTPGRTEIMLVNASVVETRIEDGEQIVSVYFDVLLREDPSQEVPSDVREVWHFVRPEDGKGSWKLDGIQQVERA